VFYPTEEWSRNYYLKELLLAALIIKGLSTRIVQALLAGVCMRADTEAADHSGAIKTPAVEDSRNCHNSELFGAREIGNLYNSSPGRIRGQV